MKKLKPWLFRRGFTFIKLLFAKFIRPSFHPFRLHLLYGLRCNISYHTA